MTPQAHPDDLLAHQQMGGLPHPHMGPGHLGLPPYGLDQQQMLSPHMPGEFVNCYSKKCFLLNSILCPIKT